MSSATSSTSHRSGLARSSSPSQVRWRANCHSSRTNTPLPPSNRSPSIDRKSAPPSPSPAASEIHDRKGSLCCESTRSLQPNRPVSSQATKSPVARRQVAASAGSCSSRIAWV